MSNLSVAPPQQTIQTAYSPAPDPSDSNGFSRPSPKSKDGDNISLSQGELIGGAIALTGAAAALGMGTTLLVKSSRKPETGYVSDAGTHIMTPNRLGGAGTHEAIPTYSPSGSAKPVEYPSPLASDGPRFHPAQSGANCAVDAVNMLVNGYGPLRTTNSDFLEMSKRAAADRAEAEAPPGSDIAALRRAARDAVTNTVIEPEHFATLYKANFDVAKTWLEQNAKRASGSSGAYQAQQRECARIFKQIGGMDHVPLRTDEDSAALRAAFRKMAGHTFVVAQPLVKNSLGMLEHNFKFKHHYYTVQRKGDTWIKRCSTTNKETRIKDASGNPVRDAYGAVKALQQHRIAEHTVDGRIRISLAEAHRPYHIFVPKKP